MDQQSIAEAFSDHRFRETYEHLAPDVRWVAVGESTLDGRDAVRDTCEAALREMAGLTTERTRSVTVAGDDAVVVDTVTRYVDGDGEASTVASCDIYEFVDGLLATITSYAVEV